MLSKMSALSPRDLYGLPLDRFIPERAALVKEADATGTSPGKEKLRELLAANAPCVVLIDELVAYVRQFPEGMRRSWPARWKDRRELLPTIARQRR